MQKIIWIIGYAILFFRGWEMKKDNTIDKIDFLNKILLN